MSIFSIERWESIKQDLHNVVKEDVDELDKEDADDEDDDLDDEKWEEECQMFFGMFDDEDIADYETIDDMVNELGLNNSNFFKLSNGDKYYNIEVLAESDKSDDVYDVLISKTNKPSEHDEMIYDYFKDILQVKEFYVNRTYTLDDMKFKTLDEIFENLEENNLYAIVRNNLVNIYAILLYANIPSKHDINIIEELSKKHYGEFESIFQQKILEIYKNRK